MFWYFPDEVHFLTVSTGTEDTNTQTYGIAVVSSAWNTRVIKRNPERAKFVQERIGMIIELQSQRLGITTTMSNS